MLTQKITAIIGIISLLTLSACGAVHTSVSKRKLDVSTKMQRTVFLTPVSPSERIIFVEVRNTSDNPGFDIKPMVLGHLQAKGYQITDNPHAATYWLQTNVLQAGKTDTGSQEKTMTQGGLTGGAIGAAAGYMNTGSKRTALATGLAGAIIGSIIEAAVKDVTYSILTDIQITERKHGNKQHQTNIVSYANQANLDIDDAMPQLSQAMAKSIAGLF